jgi:tetratricopeptide (TPR) repeat protein
VPIFTAVPSPPQPNAFFPLFRELPVADSVEREIRELRSLFWSDRDPEGKAFAPLAEAYRQLGDLDQALELLEDGLGRHADFAPGHVVAGWVRRARGETELAEEAFSSALALDDENTEALRGLAEVAVERGERPRAADFWRRVAELDPADTDARDRLVEAEWADDASEDVDPWGAEPDRIRSTDDVAHTAEELVLTADEVVLDVGEPAEATEGEVRLEPEPMESAPLGADAPTEWAPSAAEPEAIQPEAAAPTVEPEDAEDAPVTRTMADLYARQNLHERALRLYRRLLERSPDDAVLADRVREMEALASGDAAPMWQPAEAPEAPEPDLDTPFPALTDEAPLPVAADEALPMLAEEAPSPVLDEAAPLPMLAEEAPSAETPDSGAPAVESTRGAPRAPARPPRRPSDAEVEALARDWAEGPGATGELSTPFAWATRPPETTPREADAGGRPIADYFRALLEWEPPVEGADVAAEGSAEPVASQETAPMAALEEAAPALIELAGAAPALVELAHAVPTLVALAEAAPTLIATQPPAEPALEPAVELAPEPAPAAPVAPRVVVAIEALAPDARAARVVAIESLAPHVVDIASLAPEKSSDDFSRWLERIK